MPQDSGPAQYIQSIPLFRYLKDSECLDIIRAFTIEDVEPGHCICREGEPGTALYIIISGRVKVHLRTAEGVDEVLDELEPPSVFGDMALIDEQPCSATVTTVERACLYRIDRADFSILRANLQPAAFKVIRYLSEVLCQRLRDTNRLIEEFFADPQRSLKQLEAREREIQSGQRQLAYTPPPVIPKMGTQQPPGNKAAQTADMIEGAGIPEYDPEMGASAEKALTFFLSRDSVFKGMDWRELEVLGSVLSENAHATGDLIIREGEVGERLYLVAKGAVQVRKELAGGHSRILATVRPGGLFGEVSLIDGKRRSASCHAVGDTVLFSLGKSEFDALFRSNNPLAFQIMDRVVTVLSKDLRTADESYLRIFSQRDDTIRLLEKLSPQNR